MKITWFSIILLLSLTINGHGHKLHYAVVSGTVHCDVCSQQDFSKPHHFIPGASVAVECKDGDSRVSFRQEAKTDKHGEFRVRLPFSVTKHVKRIKRCSVKLVKSSEPNCAVASSATSLSLVLKSANQGTNIFSAGFLSFKPLKQPNACNKKPDVTDSKESNAKKSTMDFREPNYPIFPPPLQDPATPQPTPPLLNLPPLPQLPQLPPLLPPLPLIPFPPIPGRK